MTSTKPRIHLLPATPHDIPTLSLLSGSAFKSDTHTRLKAVIKGYDHAAETAPALQSWMSRPGRCSVIKAVTETGEIMGCITWAFRGFEGPVADVEEGSGKEESRDGEEEKVEGEKIKGTGTPSQRAKLAELEEITDASMNEWQAKLMPEGTKCMFIVGITVSPSYQGVGIGKKLVRWGTKIADEEGVFCWVHPSDGGWKVFEKEGFREVGRLEVDMDEFAGCVRDVDGGKGDGMWDVRWGKYVFRYMKRPARLVEG